MNRGINCFSFDQNWDELHMEGLMNVEKYMFTLKRNGTTLKIPTHISVKNDNCLIFLSCAPFPKITRFLKFELSAFEPNFIYVHSQRIQVVGYTNGCQNKGIIELFFQKVPVMELMRLSYK